ncbi:glycerate kinase 1 [Campylobacter sputorum subsp. bubulus]|uniref:Glycerate kinase 1 n=1 Tax=Campylobacter sputorum subsp. sputorum TaxID=32024 RepID=A0A381DI20_9BACT|nr:glycerate kinase [Campylobacter sputorum]ASM35370.1 glycerate kinase [Campylobacter sputorum aubsp. sputorum RM3237]KAB0582885.1 glycerate kinase [Campylobacter sputorum subsp. sputorum]QEL05562.1 glycerate kinase [Campylobacter sputorum subsp. sputorum]SUX08618.1 glycerate kinase 1 [Campylobacter sputorum subsp. bubulus]SUX10326.1 glycerate kinase 1 [Campylobacter sputorum subsp. sputorum]
MEKVVIAIDSFKGCMSSLEAGLAIKDGIKEFCDEVVVIPIADGGEGSVEAMKDALGAKFTHIYTFDPLLRKVKASYAFNENLAIMEMASSCGLALLKDEEKNPNKTSTYGLGIMIKDAIKKGIREFIIGIGGSATNDAGSGMLEALGFEFFDNDGKKLKMCGESLSKVSFISSKNSLSELNECKFNIACDVINPLYGTNGAAYVYARQKGADDDMIKFLDNSLKNFADITYKFNGSDFSNLQGAGAAGGLGFGFVSFLKAKLMPGFDIISNAVNLEKYIKDSNLVITGEGRIDFQSTMGKTPTKVASIAKKYSKKVIAFGGAISDDVKGLNDVIDAYFCIQQGAICLKEAMRKEVAMKNLKNISNQVMRLLV